MAYVSGFELEEGEELPKGWPEVEDWLRPGYTEHTRTWFIPGVTLGESVLAVLYGIAIAVFGLGSMAMTLFYARHWWWVGFSWAAIAVGCSIYLRRLIGKIGARYHMFNP